MTDWSVEVNPAKHRDKLFSVTDPGGDIYSNKHHGLDVIITVKGPTKV